MDRYEQDAVYYAHAGAGELHLRPILDLKKKEDVVKAIPVLTEMAVLEDVNLTVTAQGEVQPRTKINIVPQVSGKISYMSPKFIEGGHFTKGDLLIRIEPDEYRLRVVQADAMVAQAQTVLTREQSESQIALKDWEELGEGGKPSSLTLREPQMAEARAQLAAAEASLQSARLDLQRTRISAPFSGRVRSQNIGLGQYVSPGTPMGEVFSTDAILVRLPLTDHELGLLGIPIAYNAGGEGEGMPVQLTATLADRQHTWQGRIIRTDSAIDPQTRVLYAIAEVTDPYGAGAANGVPLAVGLFVTASITGRDVENAYILPRSALRGQDNVYVAEEGGTLSVRTVHVIDSNSDRVVVSSGVERGELVVTSPIRGANDGMRIQTFAQSGEMMAAYSATYDEEPAEGLAETETGDADSGAVASNG